MVKTHSNESARRLHQFLRLVTLAVIGVFLLISMGSNPFTLPALNLVLSFVVGIVAAEIWDWILWYVSEALVGE